jgi:hypothetical protein
MSPAGVSLGLLSTWLQWRRHRHLGYVLNHVLPVLKQQGHNVILAPEEYDKLLAQGRVRRVPQGL